MSACDNEKSDIEHGHQELMMLFQDCARVRDNYKKATVNYLILYTIVGYALFRYLENSQTEENNIFIPLWGLLMFLAATFCTVLVRSADNHFKIAKESSKRVKSEFTAIFKKCNKSIFCEKDDKVNRIVYHAAVGYPWLVLAWLIVFYYKVSNWLIFFLLLAAFIGFGYLIVIVHDKICIGDKPMTTDKDTIEAIRNAGGEERARLLEQADIRTVVALSKPTGAQPDAVNVAAQAELAARQHQQTLTNLKITRLGLIIAIIAVGIVAVRMLPSISLFSHSQNYICSTGQGKNLTNVIMVEEGLFSKTCRYVKKRGKTLQGDCGAELEWHVKNGYRCRKTGLDLN